MGNQKINLHSMVRLRMLHLLLVLSTKHIIFGNLLSVKKSKAIKFHGEYRFDLLKCICKCEESIDCSTKKKYLFFIYSANTTLADSPFLISQDEADQTFASSIEGGVAEPITDTSNTFFLSKNIYAKL